MFKKLAEDIDSILARDPAARSRLEILLCYPGFQALLWHRMAHGLWRRGWYLSGRFVSHLGRVLTGVEIHPGAKIGRRVFIDHGMGVVIGETAEVGDDVTLYHGVTLGGIALDQGKRHPTLEEGVIVGAGAAILGPLTVGAGARIGGNAVVLRDVPAGATMVGIPAKAVLSRETNRHRAFRAYATEPDGELPDPVARAIDALKTEVGRLNARVAELERESAAAPDPEHLTSQVARKEDHRALVGPRG
jgi:serine O-acetyltransferase